jgi:hypothetical protein
MTKLSAKFPLMLLTLLNYAPYTHTEENSTIVHEADATSIINDLVNPQTNTESLVNDFVNAEIPEFFDTLFDSHFSKKAIINETELYSVLSRSPLSPAITTKETPFELEEFDQEIPALLTIKDNSLVEITCNGNDYISTLPLAFFADLGCSKIFKATINPKHNVLFLHFGNEQTANMSFAAVINTKTLISMIIPCTPETEIKTIGICSDAIHLGVLRADDVLLSYDLPSEIVTFSPSLKQRAFMTYVNAQINLINQHMIQTDNMIKAYTRLPLNTVNNLAWLIQSNRNLLPESLYNALYNQKLRILEQILTVATNSQMVAEALNIDVDTFADKVASNEITQEEIAAILNPAESSTDAQSATA